MPDPITNFSADKFVYQFCNIINKYLLKFNPNYITYFNFIISFYLIYLFYFSINSIWIFLISILRTFLDILDGSYARYTKQVSKLGAFLDMLNDSIFMILLSFVTSIKFKNILLKMLFFLVSVILFINLVNMIYFKNNDLLNNVPNSLKLITFLIHDNTIIFVPIIIIVIFNLSIN